MEKPEPKREQSPASRSATRDQRVSIKNGTLGGSEGVPDERERTEDHTSIAEKNSTMMTDVDNGG